VGVGERARQDGLSFEHESDTQDARCLLQPLPAATRMLLLQLAQFC
jgi:hypothetical protein